jgi:hypothetical protein
MPGQEYVDLYIHLPIRLCGVVFNFYLYLVLYRCKTWSLTLREENTLRVFENGVLRRIFGPNRGEIIEG